MPHIRGWSATFLTPITSDQEVLGRRIAAPPVRQKPG